MILVAHDFPCTRMLINIKTCTFTITGVVVTEEQSNNKKVHKNLHKSVSFSGKGGVGGWCGGERKTKKWKERPKNTHRHLLPILLYVPNLFWLKSDEKEIFNDKFDCKI